MYILFDIGASKMRIAASKNLTVFSTPRIMQTPKKFKDGMNVFVRAARELAGKNFIRAVAGGIAGPLNQKKTMLLAAPNMNGWNKKPFQKVLSRALRAPILIENDTVMAGLGELCYGSAKRYKKGVVAYITISTGVGGCRFIDGMIDRSAWGFEPGHQIIGNMISKYRNIKISSCSCGADEGHLEAYISGNAIEKAYGKKPYEITNTKFWNEKARVLSYGLNNIIVLWSPHIIVLGGSMMKKIGIPLPEVRAYTKKAVSIRLHMPIIKKASLGDIGGLYGAMHYLRRQKSLH